MGLESLLYLLIVLAVVGLIVYVLVTYVPMPSLLRTVIIAVAAIAILLWLLGNLSLG